MEKITLLSLPPLKRAKAFKKLIVQEKLRIKDISRKIGKSIPFISNTLRLLKLPSIIKEGLIGKTITEGHARALLMVKNKNKMIKIYKKILIEGISVRKTEKLARKINKEKNN